MSTDGTDQGSMDDVSTVDQSLTEQARPPSESLERLPGPDVVRAVALIGVVVMNYYGYLLIRSGESFTASTVAERFFDPFGGPLSTRFAATFVLTAGVGITLLTRRCVAERAAGVAGAAAAVTEMRWRLVRRGMALYVLGQVLDVIWRGSIIYFYGAMFVVAAVLFTLRNVWIIAIGVAAALAGWWIETWSYWRVEDGASVTWLSAPGRDTVRFFIFDLGVNGTHPLLPWLAFLCAGIVLGRFLRSPDWGLWCAGLGLILYVGARMVNEFADTPAAAQILSDDPIDRGLVYVASALGTALLAYAIISWIADNARGVGARMVDPLRRAGQMSLSIYIAHILVFNLLVDWLGVVEPAGLDVALWFSAGFWTAAIAGATWWSRRYGRGPAERVYRAIGG